MDIVPIDQIDTMGRTLRENDDVETLAKSILDNGLQFPVLVRQDFVLIDGLRRMEASRQAGHDLIGVIVAHTFEQAMEALSASHADGSNERTNYPPWRLYQMWTALHGIARQSGSTRGPAHPSRTAMKEALHLSSENVLQSATFVYKIAQLELPESHVARQAVIDMEAGRINAYGARIRIYKWRRTEKRIAEEGITAAQVKRTVTAAAEAAAGLAIGLEKVPRILMAEAFTREEAGPLWTKINRLQRAIGSIGVELHRISRPEETDE